MPNIRKVITVGIREDKSLGHRPEAERKKIWVVWIGEPGDKEFKEYASRTPYENIYQVGNDLIVFLNLFVKENSNQIHRFRFETSPYTVGFNAGFISGILAAISYSIEAEQTEIIKGKS